MSGPATLGALGHFTKMKAGRSAGRCSSTSSWSDFLSWPVARVVADAMDAARTAALADVYPSCTGAEVVRLPALAN